MAVLLAKPPTGMETVNDLHKDLINLARVIQCREQGPVFYRAVRRAWQSQEAYQALQQSLIGDDLTPLNRAIAYFITSWQGMNGLSGTKRYTLCFAARYTQNGGHAAKRYSSAVESIPAWRRRMRNVTILNRDGFELLEKIEDAPGVVVYLDPPYLEKGAEYVHDLGDEDHARLAELAGRFRKTRVLVSYYAHPRLAELYPGWNQRSFDVSKALVSQGRRQANNPVRAHEVLLINGPSLAEDTGLFGRMEAG